MQRKGRAVADRRSHPRLRHAALPALIFLVVTLATIAASIAFWRSAQARDQARFDAESQFAAVAVFERMERQVALLRGAAGLFAATGGVDANAFNAYVERLGLARRYPGVLGIGYTARLQGPAERDAFVAATRAGPASGFRIFPEGTGPTYQPVVYLSPLDSRNRRTIGYDMFTERTRRAAMIRARDEGTPAVTGRVALLQDDASRKQPGFLVYVPVYRGGRVPVTQAGRERLLQGFVYSPIRARDLFETVFDPEQVRSVDIAIYDDSVRTAGLLYTTGTVRRDARFYEETTVRVAGHPWVLATAAQDAFSDGSQRGLAWWAGIVGLLAASVLAFAAYAQGRAALAAERARADLRKLNETLEARVEERTTEVSTANAGLRREIELRQGAEDQVRQMQKMEAVGQLTGGIAHDFNNMLAIVIGSLDMARRRIADPERVGRLIDNAMEGATRAAVLTQRLLAFSRRQPLTPQVIDVNRLVAGMSELLRRTLGEAIRLDTALAGGLWTTFADTSQLENAIINLAVNARDAMPGGGSLSIATANRSIDADIVASNPIARVGDFVAITVSDDGEGMPPEIVAKAFDPFFTTKEVGKGTGLGLSQVLGFIQQSGGYVEIESTPFRGTDIRIFLPRYTGSEPGAAASADDASTNPIPRGTPAEIILVVEDEDQVRLMTVEALRDLGYTVLHASGGAEALRKLSKHPGVRLLFTDVVMPEMNGRELADAALAASPDLKLLFTTGYAQDAIVHDGKVDDDVDLVSKPFTFEQLARKIRGVLDA